MDAALEQFTALWATGKGDQRDIACDIADEYVRANYDRLSPILEPLSLEGIVDLVTAYREAGGYEEDIIVAKMWLLARYDPQHIRGTLNIGAKEMAQAVADALVKQWTGR